MRTLLLLTLTFFLSTSMYSQNYLLEKDQSGYEFDWSFHVIDYGSGFGGSDGWNNLVQFGYTHAGRFDVSVGLFTEKPNGGDIILPIQWFFNSEFSFSVLKEGLGNAPLTLNVFSGFQLGGSQNYYDAWLRPGISLHKRIKKKESFSLNPGLIMRYSFTRSGYGFLGLGVRLDCHSGDFRFGPSIMLEDGVQYGISMGFVLPSVRR
ncbi:MAG: hypothetical protein R8P61_00330 [Bacteroidia bacterium]|nr:hypothetical protein [Bacteroidia bacterium]